MIRRDDEGHPEEVLSTFNDITELHRTKASLREVEARYVTLFERTTNPIFIVDLEGRYLHANEAALRFVECTLDELKSKMVRDFAPPEKDLEALQREHRRLWKQGGVVEARYRVADQTKTLMLTITSTMLHGERVLFGIGHDVTEIRRVEQERRQLEARVRQGQKLEAVGQLAGGIAHDFNNLLVGVQGNAELALLDVEPESAVRELLEDIELSAHRASDLCRQMLAFAGQGKLSNREIDLNQVIEQGKRLLQLTMAGTDTLRLELDPGPLVVNADLSQIRQILVNLVTNAAEAVSPGPGEITLRTRTLDHREIELSTLSVETTLAPRRYVAIEVEDDGCGMDEEMRARVFDPFYSTKFTGRGLGLSATLGIVRGHSGAIGVQSTPGRGSRFTVYLPLARDQRASQQPGGSLRAGDSIESS